MNVHQQGTQLQHSSQTFVSANLSSQYQHVISIYSVLLACSATAPELISINKTMLQDIIPFNIMGALLDELLYPPSNPQPWGSR